MLYTLWKNWEPCQSLLHSSYENDCEQVRAAQLDVHSISVPEHLRKQLRWAQHWTHELHHQFWLLTGDKLLTWIVVTHNLVCSLPCSEQFLNLQCSFTQVHILQKSLLPARLSWEGELLPHAALAAMNLLLWNMHGEGKKGLFQLKVFAQWGISMQSKTD